MRGLDRRVTALEACGGDLSPAIKLWLGLPLTDAEHTMVAEGRGEPEPCDPATLPKEIKEWLGID